MYLPLPTKQQITSSLSEKDNYVDVLKDEWNSTSTYVPAQLPKDKLILRHIDTLTKSNIKIEKNLTYIHFIGCRNYTKILVNHASYQILVTTLLPSYLTLGTRVKRHG